jgi:hypothetical protein
LDVRSRIVYEHVLSGTETEVKGTENPTYMCILYQEQRNTELYLGIVYREQRRGRRSRELYLAISFQEQMQR